MDFLNPCLNPISVYSCNVFTPGLVVSEAIPVGFSCNFQGASRRSLSGDRRVSEGRCGSNAGEDMVCQTFLGAFRRADHTLCRVVPAFLTPGGKMFEHVFPGALFV